MKGTALKFALTNSGIDFFTGVPDSTLAPFVNALYDTYALDKRHHIITANEGSAVSLAAGYHLATGKVPLVYLQNSGLGNLTNPYVSLFSEAVADMPFIMMLGFRGEGYEVAKNGAVELSEGAKADEPQHKLQGALTRQMLDLLGFEVFYVSENTSAAEVESVVSEYIKNIENVQGSETSSLARSEVLSIPSAQANGEGRSWDSKFNNLESAKSAEGAQQMCGGGGVNYYSSLASSSSALDLSRACEHPLERTAEKSNLLSALVFNGLVESNFDSTVSTKSPKPLCLLVGKKALTDKTPCSYTTPYTISRQEAVSAILKAADILEDSGTPTLFVSTTGKISRELYSQREEEAATLEDETSQEVESKIHSTISTKKTQSPHQKDFKCVGAMGHASMLALGSSIFTTAKTILLDGDGASLMHLGNLSSIQSYGGSNLIYILLNNAAHQSVGGLPTTAQSINFKALAKAFGFERIYEIDKSSDLDSLDEAFKAGGKTFIKIDISLEEATELGRPRLSPKENKAEVMAYLRSIKSHSTKTGLEVESKCIESKVIQLNLVESEQKNNPRALILNSGLGSRLSELTREKAKGMVEIDGKSLVARQIEALARLGIQDFVITTGHARNALMRHIEDFVDANLKQANLNFTFIDNPEYKDTNYIYSIYLAKDALLQSSAPLLLLHGDLIFDASLASDLLNAKTSSFLIDYSLPLTQKDFKCTLFKDNSLEKISVDLFTTRAQQAFNMQPMYFLQRRELKAWLDKIAHLIKNGNAKVYAENALNEITQSVKLYPLDIANRFIREIDTLEDLEQTRKIYELNNNFDSRGED